MADNVTLDSMSGGDVAAADEISGVKYQRIKLIYGGDGVNSGDVSDTNPFPINIMEIGGTAVTLGQKAMTASIPVVLASDQSVTLEVNLDESNDSVLVYGSDDGGTTKRVIKTAADGAVAVDIESSALPSGAATLAEQQSQTTALQIMDDWDNGASDGASVSGDVAHDGADAGEPVKIGAKAIAHGANPTAVAANDRTNLYANRAGVQFVIGGHPNIVGKHINVTDADGAQTDTALVTVSAGTIIVVVGVVATADNANTGDVAFRLGFGTANTPANDAASGMIVTHPGVAKGGGVAFGGGGGILGMGADGSDLRLTCEDPAGGSFDVTVLYYTIES